MSKVKVVLKDGATVEILGADSADWLGQQKHVGANAASVSGFQVRLVVKEGERIAARFNGDDVAGYTVEVN